MRVRTEKPVYSDLPENVFDLVYSVYGKVEELLPEDIPVPLVKEVVLSHFEDVNLFHDLMTDRAVTGILHLINKTPIEWYSKLQSTVETATYGSEFVAAQTAADEIIDIRTTLRYLSVLIKKNYMFRDNHPTFPIEKAT